MKAIRVGLVGSGFVSTIHADALKRVPGAELFAVVSPTGEHAAEFANRHGVRHHFRDYRRFLEVAELAHFVDCVANDKQPLETGEDGRAVLEIVLGAYASAGTGKKIDLPFTTDAERPIALWRRAQSCRFGGKPPAPIASTFSKSSTFSQERCSAKPPSFAESA